ncbi:MAG: chemotaxis protein CheW [Treponema sp.]|jgi:purine-binding chemotaxis protein CheW|nr:chemotaxis protein CheW [Treponema sp.]
MSDEASGENAPAVEKFLVFTVRDNYYALPSKLVGEVAALEKVFPLPLAGDRVRGIINRYSVPYALMDTGFLFTQTVSVSASKIIVLKEGVEKIAFLIDEVVDIADVPADAMLVLEQDRKDVPSGVPAPSALVAASFEWKGRTALCLDLGAVLESVKAGVP